MFFTYILSFFRVLEWTMSNILVFQLILGKNPSLFSPLNSYTKGKTPPLQIFGSINVYLCVRRTNISATAFLLQMVCTWFINTFVCIWRCDFHRFKNNHLLQNPFGWISFEWSVWYLNFRKFINISYI